MFGNFLENGAKYFKNTNWIKEFKIRLEEDIFNKQLLGSVVEETKIMNLNF